MELSRRNFLAGGAALVAATVAPDRLLAEIEKHATPISRLDLARWPDVRAQFLLSREYRHFASFFLASHPKPVRDAIESYRKALDSNPFITVEHGLFDPESENLHLAVCKAAAAYLGGRPEEIALVGNTTTGLALVYHGLALKPGDDVLVTTHDHYVHHESIRMATARAGAHFRKIALFERSADADAGVIAQRIRDAILPQTRALGVTWVHSSTGVRLAIRAIAEVVSQANRGRAESDRVLLIVDGVHGIGAVDETVSELGCDFFCAGTHKWLFAPRGTGIVWARAENWARLRPLIPTMAEMASFQAWMEDRPLATPTSAARMSPGGFAAFEHLWAMGAAFRFHEAIGRDRVGARIRQLNGRLKDGLASIKRVTLHTPRGPALSAGITCFEVDGLAPGEVVKRLLERKIIASTSPYRPSYVRLAPSLVNDEADVDAALAALRVITAA